MTSPRDTARFVLCQHVRFGVPMSIATRDRLWAQAEPDAEFEAELAANRRVQEAANARFKADLERMRPLLEYIREKFA